MNILFIDYIINFLLKNYFNIRIKMEYIKYI